MSSAWPTTTVPEEPVHGGSHIAVGYKGELATDMLEGPR